MSFLTAEWVNSGMGEQLLDFLFNLKKIFYLKLSGHGTSGKRAGWFKIHNLPFFLGFIPRFETKTKKNPGREKS